MASLLRCVRLQSIEVCLCLPSHLVEAWVNERAMYLSVEYCRRVRLTVSLVQQRRFSPHGCCEIEIGIAELPGQPLNIRCGMRSLDVPAEDSCMVNQLLSPDEQAISRAGRIGEEGLTGAHIIVELFAQWIHCAPSDGRYAQRQCGP
jgi:hypothetical protein